MGSRSREALITIVRHESDGQPSPAANPAITRILHADPTAELSPSVTKRQCRGSGGSGFRRRSGWPERARRASPRHGEHRPAITVTPVPLPRIAGGDVWVFAANDAAITATAARSGQRCGSSCPAPAARPWPGQAAEQIANTPPDNRARWLRSCYLSCMISPNRGDFPRLRVQVLGHVKTPWRPVCGHAGTSPVRGLPPVPGDRLSSPRPSCAGA